MLSPVFIIGIVDILNGSILEKGFFQKKLLFHIINSISYIRIFNLNVTHSKSFFCIS